MSDPVDVTTFWTVIGAVWATLCAVVVYLANAVPRVKDIENMDVEIKRLRERVHSHDTDITRLNLVTDGE